MKKKQRQMIGMLLALVVLAAVFLGIRQYNKKYSIRDVHYRGYTGDGAGCELQ